MTSPDTSAAASVSVVIPSFQSPHLGRVLDALRRLGALEILVVDSSPSPPQLDSKIEGVTLISLEVKTSPAEARNLGARKAKGEFLLFVDSDLVLPPESIARIKNILADPPDAMISGAYDPTEPRDRFFSRLQNRVVRHRMDACPESEVQQFYSSHFLIPKKMFEQAGGFNEALWIYEDMDFLARLRCLGFEHRLDRDFIGAHLKEYDPFSLLADYAQKVYAVTRAKRRHPDVFRGIPSYVSRPLALSWLAGPLFPAIAIAMFPFGTPLLPAALLSWGILAACLHVFLGRVLDPEPPGFRLKALAAWPFIGLTVFAAAGAGNLAWLLAGARRKAVALCDFLRAAKRVLLRDGMPVQIIAYVTSRCNLRCQHCFYKETLDAPDPGEMPLEVFERRSKEIGPVLWFALGGGEPVVRRDLDKLIGTVQRNCRPKIFSLPTNGWYTRKTFDLALRCLQRMDGGSLILFFSVDGPRKIHDAIRGPNSFDRVKKTIDRLRPLTKLYPNLYLNVTFTVTEQNADAAPEFVKELSRDFRPSAISVSLFRYHSLNHPPLSEKLIEGYKSACAVYEQLLREGALSHYGFFGGRALLFKEILQKDLIYRVAKNDEFVTPCTAGTLSYVIMEDGRVLPCEILPDTIGNAVDSGVSFREMIRGKSARELRKRIRDTDCRCTYECAMSTNTLFSWPMSKRLAKAMAFDVLSPGENRSTRKKRGRIPETTSRP